MRTIAKALYDRRDAHARPLINAQSTADFGIPDHAVGSMRVALYAAVDATPRRRLPFVVFKLTVDGCEVFERDELVQHWRRCGLGQLASRLRAQPRDLGWALVYVEGDDVGLYRVRVA